MLLANCMAQDISKETLDWTVLKILMIFEVDELLNIARYVIDKIPHLWELNIRVSRQEKSIHKQHFKVKLFRSFSFLSLSI